MRWSTITRYITSGLILGFFCSVPVQADEQLADNDISKPYAIEDGKVSGQVFIGWRVFHSTCYVCHGIGGTGTSVAPNLTLRVKTMTPIDFAVAVLFRYPMIVGFEAVDGDDLPSLREQFIDDLNQYDSGRLTMPAWNNDPNVKPHVMDLYAYLRARADGALDDKRPQVLQ